MAIISINNNITTINLNNKNIKILNKDIFKQYNQPLIIDISNNKLVQLNDDLFYYNDLINKNLISLNIYTLFITNNKIELLSENVINHLSNLRFITLRKNKISFLSEKLFYKMNLLIGINLSNNNISHLDINLFKDIFNLKILLLNNNKIKDLKNGIFDNLLNLKVLKINNNQIEFFHENLFSKLIKLKELEFQNNNLIYLPINFLLNCNNELKIISYGNPFINIPNNNKNISRDTIDYDIYIFNKILNLNNDKYCVNYIYKLITNYESLKELKIVKPNYINIYNGRSSHIKFIINKIQVLINLTIFINQDILFKIWDWSINKLINKYNELNLFHISYHLNLNNDIQSNILQFL